MYDLRGFFGGLVEDNRDPEMLGRLKVRVPHVYGAVGSAYGAIATNDLPWALQFGSPCGMTAKSGGVDWLPEIGDMVAVSFLDNEPEKPIWQWFMQTQQASKNYPINQYAVDANGTVTGTKRGAWTRYGHTVEWNAESLISTTSKGYSLLLTDASAAGNDGNILLTTQAGQYLELDDSTNNITLNGNNDWYINVTKQILAYADSFSLTTLSHEIEFISGSELTVDTITDLKATVGQDFDLTVTGNSLLNLTGTLTINDDQNIVVATKTNLSLNATQNVTIAASNAMNITSSGTFSLASTAAMSVNFTTLSLGAGAASPFVLGDTLLAYLDSLYQAILNHTHAGVFPGSSTTSTMLPPPPPPLSSMLSSVIVGK